MLGISHCHRITDRVAKYFVCQESIFMSVCGRLDSLKNKLEPMFEETKRLEQLKLNADLTLSELDPVINHYQVIRTTDWIIRQG